MKGERESKRERDRERERENNVLRMTRKFNIFYMFSCLVRKNTICKNMITNIKGKLISIALKGL